MIASLQITPVSKHQSGNQIDQDQPSGLPDPKINSAQLYMETLRDTNESQTYTPIRCDVCGLTQKLCHQAMKMIHDPANPNKCRFRGPKHIVNKHISEAVM